MFFDPCTPRTVGRDTDPDARTPDDRAGTDAAVIDVQAIAKQIETILRQRDSHRHRQVARTATELVLRERCGGGPLPPPFHGAGTPATHHLETFERIERTKQH